MTPLVRAGGGVVWRRGGDEALELLIVHRPRYGDWSFPKGKVDDGDADDLATALREVWEETGLRCTAGPELPSVRYTDRKGRPKVVRYWAMSVMAGELTANDEVDAMEWVSPTVAAQRLSYEHDQRLADSIDANPAMVH